MKFNEILYVYKVAHIMQHTKLLYIWETMIRPKILDGKNIVPLF